MVYYTADELNAVFEGRNPPSPPLNKERADGPDAKKGARDQHPGLEVRQLLGMWGVSEPAACLPPEAMSCWSLESRRTAPP